MPAKNQNKAKSRPFPWPCPNCLTLTVVPTVIDYTAKVKQDGVVHELYLPALEVPRCQTCGETVITTAVDEKINDALRAKLRLLTPTQMRTGIEELGLKQQEFAERLGVAPETISRWLNGALIQSRAMDNLLRLFFALPDVREALQGATQDPQLGTEVCEQSQKKDYSLGEDCPEPIARRLRTCQYECAVKAYGEDGLRKEVAMVRERGSFFQIGQE
jgi:putative zinc finger/helix-turn-helix YgiT family protein